MSSLYMCRHHYFNHSLVQWLSKLLRWKLMHTVPLPVKYISKQSSVKMYLMHLPVHLTLIMLFSCPLSEHFSSLTCLLFVFGPLTTMSCHSNRLTAVKHEEQEKHRWNEWLTLTLWNVCCEKGLFVAFPPFSSPAPPVSKARSWISAVCFCADPSVCEAPGYQSYTQLCF